MDVSGGWIDAKLHAQWPAKRELLGQFRFTDNLSGSSF
jgi:hypothetical protein